MIAMARRKKESQLPSVQTDAEKKGKQIRIDEDTIDMIQQMVGHNRGAVGDMINNILRPIVTERYREWIIQKVKSSGISPEEILRSKRE